MKKKIIKTIIASTALTSGIAAESGTLTKIETEIENELEEKDKRANSTKKELKDKLHQVYKKQWQQLILAKLKRMINNILFKD